MKKLLLLLLLLVSLSVQAQDFKPYKIKSGKIEYEKLKYSVHAGFKKDKDGVETSFREMVPYVAESVIFYWDDFGDKAFEETYKVSEFGGKALPEKVKMSETLWSGDHRYYYNVEKNQIDESFYDLKLECRENAEYYQKVDSWFKMKHRDVEKAGSATIAGKEADYYKIDSSEDYYLWKGLILKNEMYATNGKGTQRKDIDRAKVAVKIDTETKISDTIFEPTWLKRDQLFKSIDGNKISEYLDGKPGLLEQADNVNGIKIKKNDILFFVSTDLHLSKMMVLDINKENKLTIKFTLYDNTNYDFCTRDFYNLQNGSSVDFDNIDNGNEDAKQLDLKWENTDKSNLFPINNISLFLLKASREGGL